MRNAVLLVLLFILFSMMGIAAYDFMCPNLQRLATHSGLSQSVIGVTFLAFANSSVDVFGALAAIRAGTGSLAIGEIIGGALFIDCVIVGSMCITQPIKVEKRYYVRDSFFLALSVVFLLFELHDGILNLAESLSLIALYIAYALVVVYQHYREKVVSPRSESPLMTDVVDTAYLSRRSLYSAVESRRIDFSSQDVESLFPSWTIQHPSPFNQEFIHERPDPATEQQPDPEPSLRRASDPHIGRRLTTQDLPRINTNLDVPSSTIGGIPGERSPLWSPIDQSEDEDEDLYDSVWKQLFPSYEKWDEKPLSSQIMSVVMTVPILLMTCSIPTPKTKIMVLHAIVSPLTVYLLLKGYESIRWEILVVVDVVLLAALRFTRGPSETFLMGCAVLLSVVWVIFIAGELVGVLQLLGVILQVSDAIMGLTVFAIGDSLGDFVSNIATLHAGLSTMALSACFGGPLFTILIGIGGSSLLVMFIEKTTSIALPVAPSIVISGFVLILVILILLIALPINDWHLTKHFGWITIACWFTCISLGLYLH